MVYRSFVARGVYVVDKEEWFVGLLVVVAGEVVSVALAFAVDDRCAAVVRRSRGFGVARVMLDDVDECLPEIVVVVCFPEPAVHDFESCWWSTTVFLTGHARLRVVASACGCSKGRARIAPLVSWLDYKVIIERIDRRAFTVDNLDDFDDVLDLIRQCCDVVDDDVIDRVLTRGVDEVFDFSRVRVVRVVEYCDCVSCRIVPDSCT